MFKFKAYVINMGIRQDELRSAIRTYFCTSRTLRQLHVLHYIQHFIVMG